MSGDSVKLDGIDWSKVPEYYSIETEPMSETKLRDLLKSWHFSEEAIETHVKDLFGATYDST